MSKAKTTFNLEDTWNWIEQKTFRLQPETYQKAHPDWPGAVGLEIEMLPLRVKGNGVPSAVPLQKGEGSLASLLRQMARDRQWTCKESPSDEGDLLMNVFLEHDDNLSFEPGGQLEFSSKPYECLTEAVSRTIDVQRYLDESLMRLGEIQLTQVGINPWHSVEELGLQMKKPRYIAMNEYFSRISSYGPRMMRQTCTVQVNLDFGRDEATMAKRYLASLLMAPFMGAIFNNSAVTERRLNGFGGLRSKIWRHMDPTRTGVPSLTKLKSSQSKKTCVETYFDFVCDARVVFMTDLNYKVMHEPITWRQWVQSGYNGHFPTSDDFETHLSLLFPEVRARGFLELRSVDCQSRSWQFVPAAFWTGILYNDQVCARVIEKLLPFENQMEELLDAACYGLKDSRIFETAKLLVEFAETGLRDLPTCYHGQGVLESFRRFTEAFTLRRRVPSDGLRELMEGRDEPLDWQTFQRSLQT